MSSPFTITQDFRQEVEAETLRLLRRRFLYFLWTVAALYALSLLLTVAGLGLLSLAVGQNLVQRAAEHLRGGSWGLAAIGLTVLVDAVVFVWFLREATARRNDRGKLLKLTQQFLMYRGAVDLVMALVMRSEGFPWYIGMYHTIGCALLPWTPAQALRPMLFLVPLNAITLFVSPASGWLADTFWAVMSCLIAFPGLGVAWAKTTQRSKELRLRFLQDRYGQMRRELVDARRIHEALFPPPFSNQALRFSYRYEPMRQIGGDYLYARFCPGDGECEPAFNLLLIDVTGHGIAAALTVNRLYGEVERLFAEDPMATPADVLAALNRYVNLTLSRHSIYATALCMRVDPARDRLEYASGGHPPAFLLGADGRIVDLESTSYVLGAVNPGDFDAGMRTLEFLPGDAVLAYTDGAIEARNPDGRMLGVFGLQRALASCVEKGSRERHNALGELTTAILEHIEQHRGGPPEDDTLVVELFRHVGGGAAAATSREGAQPSPVRVEPPAQAEPARR